MRLIDADAEIEKIEEEIRQSRKAIEKWQLRQLEGSSLYDIDAKIRELQNNITDCKREIRMLRSYTTAYDVDKVIEKLKQRKQKALKLAGQYSGTFLGHQGMIMIDCYENAIHDVKEGKIIE